MKKFVRSAYRAYSDTASLFDFDNVTVEIAERIEDTFEQSARKLICMALNLK